MRRSTVFLVLAGSGDTLTGIMLMLWPQTTLGLIGIDSGTLVFPWQLIGAFVFSVGSSYYAPLKRRDWLVQVVALTAWLRACVGLFIGCSVLLGYASVAWLTISATDLTLALCQITWLVLREE